MGSAPGGGAGMVAATELTVDQHGVVGDRYRDGEGRWSSHRTSPLTLVAAGDVGVAARELGVQLDPLALRRNVVLDGRNVADLVGTRFRLGEVLLRGERVCAPCRYLEELLGIPGLKDALGEGRGGLRATVLTPGRIRIGDRVEPSPTDNSTDVVDNGGCVVAT